MPIQGEKCTIQILFTSDVHAAFRNYNYLADKPTLNTGINKISTLIKREKAAYPDTTVVLDAGDMMQGNGSAVLMTKAAGKFRPFPLLAVYDVIGYDAVVTGNHEFNFGIPNMLTAFEGYKGIRLCANVIDPNGDPLPGFEPYMIKTFDSGLRVAFIGMVSPNIEKWDKKNVLDQGYRAQNVATRTRQIIDQLKAENAADVFVMAAHMDEVNEMNTPYSGAMDVIDENQDLTVFLGAHFHEAKGSKEKQLILCNAVKFVENVNSAGSLGKVLITATYEDGRWQVKNKLGSYEASDVKTDVLVLPDKPELEVPNDPAIDAVTQQAHDYLLKYMRETIVGRLEGGPMVSDPEIKGTSELVLQPTALNQFIANVYRHYTGAPIAAVSPNDYSANCEEGDISIGKIVKMYVYENNSLCTVRVTGRQLQKWLEWSYTFYGQTHDDKPDKVNPALNLETDLTIPYEVRRVYRLDHFTGIDYEVDITKPVGQRVNVIRLSDGMPFNMDEEYVVAVNNYRVTTNLTIWSDDGIFPKGETLAKPEQMDIVSDKGASNVLDFIQEYIEAQPNRTITNKCIPNWRLVNLDFDPVYRAKAIAAINSGKIKYDYKRPVTKAQIDSLEEQ